MRCAAAAAGSLPDALGLSHELRTPLNAILGGVELMLEGAVGPLAREARSCLCDIQDASRRLQRRIEDLLLLLDLRERTAPSGREGVDLLELLRDAAGRTSADLVIAPLGARLLIDGDRLLLQRMAQIIVETVAAEEVRRIDAIVEPPAAPTGTLSLRFDLPDFDPGRVLPIHAALIKEILRLQDASGGWRAGVMEFRWPAPAIRSKAIGKARPIADPPR